MEILNIKRPNKGIPKTGLKLYATVLGDSGVEYKVGYFRRPSFRGWMCSCPNFILSQFAKGGHCKHIDHVQDQYGRYGAAVQPTKQRPKTQVFTFNEGTNPGGPVATLGEVIDQY